MALACWSLPAMLQLLSSFSLRQHAWLMPVAKAFMLLLVATAFLYWLASHQKKLPRCQSA